MANTNVFRELVQYFLTDILTAVADFVISNGGTLTSKREDGTIITISVTVENPDQEESNG
jgi:hypothetical protein